MAIEKLQASTLADVLAAVKKVKQRWDPSCEESQELWFRGCPRRKYKLVPGLYRTDVRALNYDEFTLMKIFCNLASPQVHRQIAPWDWYILAQHYGMRTRLLDWTEALLPAVFFATEEHILSLDRNTFYELGKAPPASAIYDDESPAIWIIEPACLNEWSGHELSVFSLDSDGNEQIRDYLWDRLHAAGSGVAERPVAAHPPWTNPRIVAQQGKFTIHGKGIESLDEFADTDKSNKLKVAQITLDRANLVKLWEELETAGIWRLGLFPELDSVAQHVLWHYQDTGGK